MLLLERLAGSIPTVRGHYPAVPLLAPPIPTFGLLADGTTSR